MYDVAIIGCGVIGAATAYALSHYNCKVVVLEAENDVADGTTKANSAILHAGYDPEPGTQMARLNVKGVAMAKEICARLDVPYKQCGSFVLALAPEELPHLQHLYENGKANGVPGIRLLNAAETLAMEPNLAPTVAGALYAPSAAIVSPWEYALAMAEVAVRNGVELRRSCPVKAITRKGEGFSLTVPGGTVEAKYVINAAGVYAEAVHAMVAKPNFHIQPTRGEYYLLDKSEGTRVNHVIFQCPNELGKGVLVSPTVHGNLIVGPNAERVEGENTACTSEGLAYVSSTAKRSVPGINFGESIRNFAGVRANVDVDDFIIGEAPDAPGLIDLAGMKSPGLSSAPAVAEEAVKILAAKKALGAEKTSYKDGRKHIRFKELSVEEKKALVAKDPAYGRVICRCETITEGEILAAIHSEIPATTIDGVKRRAGSGMGRCQGGFCGPRVLELLSRELGLDPLDVLQDKDGTNVLVSETKQGGKHHV
jgi:glycerol-3-phosphate dehydrogenase